MAWHLERLQLQLQQMHQLWLQEQRQQRRKLPILFERSESLVVVFIYRFVIYRHWLHIIEIFTNLPLNSFYLNNNFPVFAKLDTGTDNKQLKP